MYDPFETKLYKSEQTAGEAQRYLNPEDIVLKPGYVIEAFLQGLDVPSRIAITEEGDILIAQSGYISKKPNILRYRQGSFEVIADGFLWPLTGMTYYGGNIYVTHLGKISIVYPDGTKEDILKGLPNYGDYWGSNVAFGPDGKMYFAIGTATNSGVVGTDNKWIFEYPFFCDYPGQYIILTGQNFETENQFIPNGEDTYTGAFSPYGVPSMSNEIRKGFLKASGSILRANPDGTQLEQVAWGFRYPATIKFDMAGRLFASNQSYEIRGSRPIANAPDEFYLIQPGMWYGWPDFAGGEAVSNDKYRPDGETITQPLILNYPNIPPKPYALFSPLSNLAGFVFNYNADFGPYGDVYIAEYGSGGRIVPGSATPFTGEGFRVSQINMATGGVSTFAMNKSGFTASITHDGGFGRPADITFGPDGAMYVLDAGISSATDLSAYLPYTGSVWKITKI